MDIYQSIWEADLKGNGLQPILASKYGNKTQGYVVVDFEGCYPDHHIFKEVYIPDQKKRSYQLVEKLFDNYTLNQVKRENHTLYESKEIDTFLKMAIGSSPCRLAKKLIEEKTNRFFSEKEWYTLLHNLWFRQFNWETLKDVTGFEHVFIGEQKGRKLVGHHFWYKYWIEDNVNPDVDQIDMACALKQEYPSPYVVTLGYHLKAYDQKKRKVIKIMKKKCAFFVGLSPEGVIALGAARALLDEMVPDEIVIDDTRYKLELFKSPDMKSIRTFYPIPIT